jgi:hypothetical protein
MKTEVYSWRVSRELKSGLEREARRRKLSLSAVLDLAVLEGLDKRAPIPVPTKSSIAFIRWQRKRSVPLRAEILLDPRTCASLYASVCDVEMTASALIDTGAILALLDRSDGWRRLCVEVFRQLRLPLMTSEAVLTELFHLVGDSRHEMELPGDW